MKGARWPSALVLLLATAVGVAAFARPFVAPAAGALTPDAPLATLALTALSVLVVVASLTQQRMNARALAVLGILTAANAVLRALPGPAGFSAIFFLLGLTGYVYGPTAGFLLGVLSLLVSALIGGGVGPWLPYQMFAAGWMGMSSGWLPDLQRHRRLEIAMLALWTALWGFLFGAVMNLWFWPYIAPVQALPGQAWTPGGSSLDALRRYAAFYVATSLWWDAWRAGGNAALILALGTPVLKTLRRFEHVLGFTVIDDER